MKREEIKTNIEKLEEELKEEQSLLNQIDKDDNLFDWMQTNVPEGVQDSLKRLGIKLNGSVIYKNNQVLEIAEKWTPDKIAGICNTAAENAVKDIERQDGRLQKEVDNLEEQRDRLKGNLKTGQEARQELFNEKAKLLEKVNELENNRTDGQKLYEAIISLLPHVQFFQGQ